MRPPAGRYASAFLDALVADLQQYVQALAQSPDLRAVMRGAEATRDEKKELLRQVFGNRIDPFSMRLLHLLLDQDKLAQTEELTAFLAELLRHWRDLLPAHITTATPLSAEEEERLCATLHERYGQEILLEKAVDPQLIGGAVLRVHDQVFDGSVKRQLAEIEKELL